MPAILDRNTVVWTDVEATKGTPASLTDANAVQINQGSTFQPNVEEIINPALTGSLDTATPDAIVPSATITIPCALRGSGTADVPPETGPLFRACRYAEVIVPTTSVTYTPTSGAEESVTIEFYKDGLQWIAVGCVGTVTFDCAAKDFFIANFTMTGRFVSKADVALPSATFDATVAQAWVNGLAQADGSPVVLQNFTLDPGNTIGLFDNPNQVTGFEEATVTERDVRGTMTIQSALLATRDFFNTNLLAGTTMPLVMRTGTTPGNIVTLNVPNARLVGETPESNQGAMYDNYAFKGAGINAGMDVVFT